MRRSNRIAAQQFSLQYVLAVARDPLLQALCKDGQNISAAGVRATLDLAQLGVLGKPEQANLALSELWQSLSQGSPAVNSSNSLEEIFRACSEAGIAVTAESTKEDLLARLPANVPPSLYKLMKDFNFEQRKAACRALIPQLNAGYPTAQINIANSIYIKLSEAKDPPFNLPGVILEGLDYRKSRGGYYGYGGDRRRYLIPSVAELALEYHGTSISEEQEAEIIAKRDAAVERIARQKQKKERKLNEKEAAKWEAMQRREDLQGAFEDYGLGDLPKDKGAFSNKRMYVSGAHVFGWEGKEITLERAVEAAKEAVWYKKHLTDVRWAAEEKFKASDYLTEADSYSAVRRNAAGRGKDSLKIILNKGLEHCKQLPDMPGEMAETIQRYEEVLALGVNFPMDASLNQYQPFNPYGPDSLYHKFKISAEYVTNQPHYGVHYRLSSPPSFSIVQQTVEDAQWYVAAGGAYFESPHIVNEAAGNNTLDTCREHVTIAKAYVEQHGAEAVLAMEPKPPALVIKAAEESIAEAYVAEVGNRAAYTALQMSKNSTDATLPLALRLECGRLHIPILAKVELKHAHVKGTDAIKTALEALHTTLPVSEHGLGPALIYSVLYGEDIGAFDRLKIRDAAKEYDGWWRLLEVRHRKVYNLPDRFCPSHDCNHAERLPNYIELGHFREHHGLQIGMEPPEHFLMEAADYAPPGTVFPAMPEEAAFSEFLEEICSGNAGPEMAAREFAPDETAFPAIPEKAAFAEYLEEICSTGSSGNAGREMSADEKVQRVKELWEEWKSMAAEGVDNV